MRDNHRLEIKFRTAGKAFPPRPIRVEVPGWGGSPDQKRQNRSTPQPWHCAPFVEGGTYGLELLYQYETECHVINNGRDLQIEWDYRKEPGGVLGQDEFSIAATRPAHSYVFATSVDMQAPPGHVLRTEPHTRFFTDITGTVPVAIVGHVQTEWWAKKLFVSFKAPDAGQRHIFRKGEPYVQILFVPQRMAFPTIKMNPDEEAARSELEEGILAAKSHIAKNVWYDPAGNEFNDHYKVLSRAFAQDGHGGVMELVRSAAEHEKKAVPRGMTLAEYFALADKYQKDGKYIEAKATLAHARSLNPNNAETSSRMGTLAQIVGLPEVALQLMGHAARLDARSPTNQRNLGNILKEMGRLPQAEAAFRASLALAPNDPEALAQLGLTLALQGRGEEARACHEAALAIDRHHAPALRGLAELPARTPQ
ncbi:MAG: uncharacterized protein JWN51_219 [Phycisphaerales bacterium]|nr:uncharacterized protein [Phycisphaerales bacterium]